MADDFLRLVSTANPAARQYHPANGGYPPSSSASPYNHPSGSAQLDPFFDDEDDVPDSAFGMPAAMQSKESGLPFARSGAPPAGMEIPADRDILQDWDDEVQAPSGSQANNGAAAYPGGPPGSTQPKLKPPKRPRRWKWPWQKEEAVLTGERLIALNNSAANTEFISNYVSTSKYNAATFLPKFLFGASKLCVMRCCAELNLMFAPRAILEIRQPLLLIHRCHPTNTRSLSNKSVYHNCPSCCSTTRLRHQGVPGRPGELASMLLLLRAYMSLRNGINQTQN